ncbi:MAG: glycosyltransferase family 2 protein [Bacillota bacterium]|nr:glycosyltransferase family 2 protein [Bacillota bacterium]
MVSIIIPVYNVEKYLKYCIDSVLNQTFKKIEIILINDGSTDSSGQICNEYAKKHKNITLINQKNSGSGVARNKGLELAKGRFIAFCDPDDFLPQDAIKKYINAMNKNNADLAIGFIKELHFDNNKKLIAEKEPKIFDMSIKNRESFSKIFFELYDQINMRSPCNKLYSIKVIKENNIKFPGIRRSQDIVFNNEYYKYVKKVEIINSYVYYRRIIKDVIYNKYVGDLASSRVVVYESYKDLISFWGLNSKNAFEFLNKILFREIWDYQSFIINNSKLSWNEKLRLMDNINIKKLLMEMRKNNATPQLNTVSSKMLYLLICYNLKVPLITYRLLKNYHQKI